MKARWEIGLLIVAIAVSTAVACEGEGPETPRNASTRPANVPAETKPEAKTAGTKPVETKTERTTQVTTATTTVTTNKGGSIVTKTEAPPAAKPNLDAEIAKFTKFIEARPTEFFLRSTRAALYRDKGDPESLRKAIADWTACLAEPNIHPNILIARTLDRAATYALLYAHTKDESTKLASLNDFTAGIKLEKRTSSHYERGKAFLHQFNEPFLAEEDIVESLRLIVADWKNPEYEAVVYALLIECYQAIAPRVKGLPQEAQYAKLLASATAKRQTLVVQKPPPPPTVDQAAERKRNALRTLQMIEKRDAAKAPPDRAKAEAEYRAQLAKTPNRAECPGCQGRGFQSAGGGREFTLNWVPNSRGTELRSTHTTRPPVVLTCPECWGRGFIGDD